MEDTLVFHVEQYLEELKSRSYAHNTIRGAKNQLSQFTLFMESKGIRRTADIMPKNIHEYHEYTRSRILETGKPISQNAVCSLITGPRTFFKWAAVHRLVFVDLSSEFPVVRSVKTVPKTLSALEAEGILALPDTDTPTGLRDRTLLELLYGTGLRRVEAANLKLEHVNLEARTLFIHEGKGRKDRMLPLGERTIFWLRRFLTEARPVLTQYGVYAKKSSDRGWFFPARLGGQSSPDLISMIASRYLRKVGFEQGACHIFRHTMATLMLENGADIRYIQEMLGHSQLKTTQIYTRVSSRHLRETLTRSHPVSWQSGPLYSSEAVHAPAAEPRRPVVLKARIKSIPTVDPSRSEIHRELCAFRDWMYATHARSTAEGRIYCTIGFVEWLFARGVRSIARVSVHEIIAYQKHLAGSNNRYGKIHSAALMLQKMCAVRWFFRWLWRNGRTLIDPTASVILPRGAKQLPSAVLSAEELEKIFSSPDLTGPHGIRDRAVIEILYATAMRRGELTGIKLTDLIFQDQTIRITDSKTKEGRVLPAGSRAFYWIELYLECAREFFAPEDSEYLFCWGGRDLSGENVQRICQKHLRTAGVKTRQPCHIFRHTAATLMLENGADIRAVQEFLGHRSINSTQRYTHVAIRKLKEVHAATHPGERRYLAKLRAADEERQQEKAAEQAPVETASTAILGQKSHVPRTSDYPRSGTDAVEVRA